ncbi:MAG: peptidase M22 [Ruminococcus sp.]|nr:peptidase M22 [Ruminococcus sp.]
MSITVGFDTSNYTTSAAVLDTSDMSVRNVKRLLPVKDGERGLRQSDAVFLHTKALPEIMEEAFEGIDSVDACGCSCAPRLVQGSYMPCFLVGMNAAAAFSHGAGCELFMTSHQIGHILAALFSCGRLDLIKGDKPFAAFHVSGGTTDLLLCTPDKKHNARIERIGGSSDLNAGQAIDRCGVRLGLSFPCGAELERLAEQSHTQLDIRPVVKGLYCSLSGIENKCMKLMDSGYDKCDVAKFCIDSVCASVEGLTKALLEKYNEIEIIYAGGVMSNRSIRAKLSQYGSFASPELSSDNAVGTAVYAALRKGLI